MTQLPDVSSLRTRGLDAALRAIGFVLCSALILFCVGLIKALGWPVRTTPFLPLPRSLWQAASDMPRRTQFFLKEIAHPILFFPGGSGPTLIVPCAIAFKIFGKNEVLPGLTAIFTWGSV